MKISVIGGGSTYTPELVNGFLERTATLPVSELCLMDINQKRLSIVGGFAQRMVQARGAPFKVMLTTNQQAAITDASYVITQLRVGQMPARVADEYLGQRNGLIGQETTGVGGMAKALRTIPVILSVAEDIRQYAKPGALLVNFTNPAGLVTQAIQKFAPDVPSVGVCNVAITTKMAILEELKQVVGSDVPPERVELNTLGLNHLSWHRGFTIDGQEIWPQVIEATLEKLRSDPEAEWDIRTIEVLGMLPNYYLQYYYFTDHKLKEQQKWPPSRGEEVLKIEKDLLRQYADPSLTSPPADLLQRGGAYYSTVATQLLNAHHNNLSETHIVNTAHRGTVKGWPEDWVLEMPCLVDKSGVHPMPTEPLPEVCFGLLAQVKSYELLTVEAAVHGDRSAAFKALLAHPLGPSADCVQAVLDDMLVTNRIYLPQFWKNWAATPSMRS
ncbi:MAG: 6-phospho-beta-glucosidase [Anaerolineales bacterium]|nr:MAG: 6-phospho-beta-glucosidase [Anaerolineales bacterium]